MRTEVKGKMWNVELPCKQILYFDMDGVLADFHRAIREKVTPELAVKYGENIDQIPGIFACSISSATMLISITQIGVFNMSGCFWMKEKHKMHL